MRSLTAIAAIAVLLSGCASPGPTPGSATPGSPSVPGSSGSAPSATAASPLPTTASPVRTTSPAATAIALDPAIKLDPARVLQVCEPFGRDTTEAPIACGDAIALAIQALGTRASGARRASFSFICNHSPTCPDPSPTRAWVTFSGSGPAAEVAVVADSTNGLTVASVSSGIVGPNPSFAPPPVARPVVNGAPKEVARRTPYPLCGDEMTKMGGPYDAAARSCFLNGVLAGASVEFVARSHGIEGEPTVEIDRYDGTGGLWVYSGDNGRWTSYRTGIGPVGGGLIFGADGIFSPGRQLS